MATLRATLTISKIGRLFEVDDFSRPGAPPVGRGRTMDEALGNYITNNQQALGIVLEIAASAQPAELRRRRRELAKR